MKEDFIYSGRFQSKLKSQSLRKELILNLKLIPERYGVSDLTLKSFRSFSSGLTRKIMEIFIF